MVNPHRRSRLASALLASLLFTLVACNGGGGSTKPDAGTDPNTPDASTPDASDTCGDGQRQAGEACDDGNRVGGDGCSATCTEVEGGFLCEVPGQPCVRLTNCGNGRVEVGEECDDRNLYNGDGCNGSCRIEAGWACPAQGGRCRAKECGDGIIAGDEECEDGNTTAGDGCSAICRLEDGWKCPPGEPCSRTVCGDGIVEGTEQCDDGNSVMGDGCSPACTKEPRCVDGNCEETCGDGIILPGSTVEQCDDGNTRANDGCSPDCKLEEGFACVLIEQEPPAQVSIPVVYRDFRGYDLPATGDLPRGHIDFQNKNAGREDGILQNRLDANGRPVYAKEGQQSNNTNGRAAFDQWYRAVDRVNKTIVGTFVLDRQQNGSYVFDNEYFFPLDNEPLYSGGWVAAGFEQTRGDTIGQQRNFHFTSEARYWFEYKGTEVLTFRGDDDVWVFVNGRLALDLGGVHGPASGTITMSSQAGALGLRLGGIYEVVVFQAERHTHGSSYRLTLNNFLTARSECSATCGDGVVDEAAGEECDDGFAENTGEYGKCGRNCLWGPRCGDGIWQEEEGEECDDGNTVGRDGCSSTCKLEIG